MPADYDMIIYTYLEKYQETTIIIRTNSVVHEGAGGAVCDMPHSTLILYPRSPRHGILSSQGAIAVFAKRPVLSELSLIERSLLIALVRGRIFPRQLLSYK